jgi:hypothetical protein
MHTASLFSPVYLDDVFYKEYGLEREIEIDLYVLT